MQGIETYLMESLKNKPSLRTENPHQEDFSTFKPVHCGHNMTGRGGTGRCML